MRKNLVKKLVKKLRKNKADGTTRNIRASHKSDEELLARIKRLESIVVKSEKTLRTYADGLFDFFMQSVS